MKGMATRTDVEDITGFIDAISGRIFDYIPPDIEDIEDSDVWVCRVVSLTNMISLAATEGLRFRRGADKILLRIEAHIETLRNSAIVKETRSPITHDLLLVRQLSQCLRGVWGDDPPDNDKGRA